MLVVPGDTPLLRSETLRELTTWLCWDTQAPSWLPRGLVMKYANGVEVIHSDFGRDWAVRFHGSEGTLDVSREFFETTPAGLKDIELKPGDTHLRDTGGDHIGDWLNAVRTRGEVLCNAETGHRSASVCSLANIAYHLNRPLKWDPVSERFDGDEEANRLAAE